VDALIVEVRGQKALLDADLARIYGVQTRVLNQAVRRNADRFPPDFVIELSREEILRISQSVTSLRKLRFSKQVRAFTEHGALMAANVLNSAQAVQMSVFVVRAFIKMRRAFGAQEMARKLAALEQELKSRLDIHEAAIVDILQRFMKMFEPTPPPPEPPKPQIGFHVKEDAVPYRTKKRTRNGSD
jgi:hypothetical protein